MHKKELERAEGQGPGAEGKDGELVAAARERLKDLRLQAVSVQVCLEHYEDAKNDAERGFVRVFLEAAMRGERVPKFSRTLEEVKRI